MHRIIDRLGWGIAGALGIAVVAVLGGIVSAGPLTPPGPPAATQETLIYQPADCAGFPIVIGTSGSYKLAQNITMIGGGCGGDDGIEVAASNVTIDLAGFTLTGVPGAGAGILGPGGNVTVVNGTVTSWPGDGIALGGIAPVVDGVRVGANNGRGIYADGAAASARITNNTVYANGGAGILVVGPSPLIEANIVDVNATVAAPDPIGGIVSTSSVNGQIINNTVTRTQNFKPGIAVSGFDARVAGNLSTNNTGPGILVSASETLVEQNIVSFNANGIRITGFSNVVSENTAINNSLGTAIGFLFEVGASNTIVKNIARSNPGGNYSIVVGNAVGPITTAAAATSPTGNTSD